jgi:transketolase
MVSRCLEAADALAAEGVEARVLEVHTVKPLDDAAIVAAAAETGALVTAEEHSVVGGLGAAVGEVIGSVWPVPLERVGIADRFATTGAYDAILAELGLTSDAVTAAARRAVERKRIQGGNPS